MTTQLPLLASTETQAVPEVYELAFDVACYRHGLWTRKAVVVNGALEPRCPKCKGKKG